MLSCDAVIGIGSLWKIRSLAGGGSVVAASLGGQWVNPETSDAAERRLLNVVEEMAIAAGVAVPMVFVLDDRKRGPKGRWLSLFYGAGHLPDLATRLQAGGWKFQGTDWVRAWHFTGR